ncbi:MAG: hypothetical protein ACTSYC_12405 [Promethearchaeota archaeon]
MIYLEPIITKIIPLERIVEDRFESAISTDTEKYKKISCSLKIKLSA